MSTAQYHPYEVQVSAIAAVQIPDQGLFRLSLGKLSRDTKDARTNGDLEFVVGGAAAGCEHEDEVVGVAASRKLGAR